MGPCWPLLCVALIQASPTAAGTADEAPLLSLGSEVEGVVSDGDPVVATATLTANYREALTVGRSFRLRVDATGPCTIELHSLDFDAYLVLRNRAGEVLAEDDDGLYATHARLVTPELRPGEEYRLEACALHGARGSYRLRIVAGAEPALDAVALEARVIGDLRERAERAEEEFGAESAELAERLDTWAEELRRRGKTAEALSICERALAIREKVLGPEDSKTLTSMNNRALMLYELGRYEESRSLHERTLELREKLLGADHPHTATSLNNLALAHSALGRFEEARECLARALVIDEAVAGPDDIRTLETRVNLGFMLSELGRFEESKVMIERASQIMEKNLGRADLRIAAITGALGEILMAQGNYEEALQRYEQALEVCRTAIGADHPNTAGFHGNLALVHYEQGNYAAARSQCERALAIFRATVGLDHPSAIIPRGLLANVVRAQGRFEEARSLLEAVLESSVKVYGPDHENTAAALNNIAGLLKEQGKLEEAYPLYVRALAIAEAADDPRRQSLMRGLNNLGHVLDQLGRFEEARRFHDRSLALRLEVSGPVHRDTAMALSNLAMHFTMQGMFGEARPLLERALSILEAEPESHRLDRAVCSQNLARTCAELGDYAEARKRYETALGIQEEMLGADHPSTNTARGNLATVLLDLGQDEAALGQAARTVEASRNRIGLLIDESSEFESLLYSTVHEDYLQVYFCAVGRRPDLSPPIEVYSAFLDWKGRVYRSQGRARARLLESCTGEQRQKIVRLRSAQAALSNLASVPEVKDRDEHERNLERLRKERTSLESELIASVGGISQPVPTAASVAAAIPEGYVLLDFYTLSEFRPAEWKDGEVTRKGEWSPEHMGVWLLRSGDERGRWLDLGESAAIERAVVDHLSAIIEGRSGPPSDRGVGRIEPTGTNAAGRNETETPNDRLRRLLWEPLAALVGDAPVLLVCPDRYLATLPFETILDAGGRHLIEDRAFVYLESPATLVERRASPVPTAAEGPSVLVAGALDYTDGAAAPEGTEIAAADLRGHFGHEWVPLAATAGEADAIAAEHEERFPEGRRLVLRGLEGTEERLKSEIPRHAVVHLATHGYFEPDELPSARQQSRGRGEGPRPMSLEERLVTGYLPGFLSGLVCSGANRPCGPDRDNGLLTAEEVAWLELGGCDLVVLSACQTALGESRSGEGLMSLRRSFGQAGARTVIGSLWKVEDEATRALMTSFYERLWRGDGKLSALRGAQLEMLRKNRGETGEARPATWGAFVLSGEW